VLENAAKKKRRLNPLRGQSWNRRKLIDEIRNADELRTRGMTEVARSNKSNRARVVDAICIRMKALVQLRRDAERQRAKKNCASDDRDRSTHDRAAFHWRRACVRPVIFATTFFAAYRSSESAARAMRIEQMARSIGVLLAAVNRDVDALAM
jgi:hypothetical protein